MHRNIIHASHLFLSSSNISMNFGKSICGNANENFLFWNSYLIDIFHILWDHELSLRTGDWELLKDAKKGYFVCNMTNRSTSGIGFDQALEKTYNYTS